MKFSNSRAAALIQRATATDNELDAQLAHRLLHGAFIQLTNNGQSLPVNLRDYIASGAKPPKPKNRPKDLDSYLARLALGAQVHFYYQSMKYEAAINSAQEEAPLNEKGEPPSIAKVKAAHSLFREAAGIPQRRGRKPK